MGILRYKAMLDPQQWKETYFVLQKSNLFICPGNDGAAEDIINLKRLQELSEWAATPLSCLVLIVLVRHLCLTCVFCVSGIVSENEHHEKKDILVLVEKGRQVYIYSFYSSLSLNSSLLSLYLLIQICK